MSEWGPWIEHDGKGCPCKGHFVESEDREGSIAQHIAHGMRTGAVGNPNAFEVDCWDWGHWAWQIHGTGKQVIRYRIRKPRGLTILEELLSDLPAPSAPKVDA